MFLQVTLHKPLKKAHLRKTGNRREKPPREGLAHPNPAERIDSQPAHDQAQATAIIVSRMGSSRFAGKALVPLLGKPLLEFLVERVNRSQRLERVVLATTDGPEDDRLAERAARLGLEVFRGDLEDVLGRLAAAARAFKADPIVELLGDSPLVDGELIDDVLDFYGSGAYDYVANVTREYPRAPAGLRCFPVGIRVQVMRAAALSRCEESAKEPRDREYATTFIYENPDLFRIGYFEAKGRWARLNRPDGFLAIDYPEDLKNIGCLVEATLAVDSSCSLRSLVV